MALRALLITMMVATAVSPALGDEYMVGDNQGWNRGINFTAWAQQYDFNVGDSLMFMYKAESHHNVIKVNATEFKSCTYSNTSKILTSGKDVISLGAPGKKWYISGVSDDCKAGGMKLVITVSAADGPSPSPIPGSSGTSAAGQVLAPLNKSLVVSMLAAVMLVYMSIP